MRVLQHLRIILYAGSIICFLLISLLQLHLFNFRDSPLLLPSSCDRRLLYTDDTESYRSRIMKEHEHRELLRKLSEDNLAEMEKGFRRDLTIQYTRSLLPPSPPLHEEQCLKYADTPFNLTVSVVIAFYNEVPILLMRTLTTIVHRTPPHYLAEIVIIDDCSEVDISGEIIAYSKTQRIPLRYLRNDLNIGIARSRMRGIREARGDTIAILDSHMEVADLWLEPLLATISTKPASIAVPHIAMVSERGYDGAYTQLQRNVVTLPNTFGMIYVNVKTDLPQLPWESYPSSALLGGGVVALKSTLLKFYPTPLLPDCKWGVENNRLAYRAWMCGEGIWANDCSQVIHPNGADADLTRYTIDWDYLIAEAVAELLNFCNDKRSRAKLLLKATNQPAFVELIGNFSDEIRKEQFDPSKMGCHSDYTWWTRNVQEEYLSFDSDQFTHAGEVVSVSDPTECLDFGQFDRIGLWDCRSEPLSVADNHLAGFTRNGAVMLENRMCLDIYGSGGPKTGAKIQLWYCSVRDPVKGSPKQNQEFRYREAEQWIWNPPSEMCLTLVGGGGLRMLPCNLSRRDQRWAVKLAPWFGS